MAQDSARVDLDRGVADPGADLFGDAFAAEDVAFAVLVDFGGREHDAVGALHGEDQRVVLLRLGRLAELDVVGDHLRAGLAEAVDQLGVEMAREGPLLVSALKVLSSIPTTTMSSGRSCVPRIEKRVSTVFRSSVRNRSVA